MKEIEYYEGFASQPYFDTNTKQWRLWIFETPQKDGFKVRIPIPERFTQEVVQGEIASDL